MVGFEVNKYSAMICKILIPKVDIVVDHFESTFFRGNKHLKNDFIMKPFDLVIGNPPYGQFNSFYAGLGERKFTKATQYDQYFITRGLDLLKSGGLLVMLISSYFHRADSGYDSVKKLIASKAILLRKITLPNGVVPYTEVGTDIVIYKKR
jgi:tRNA1(Val) A37 N6-methylase TrmN6